MIYESKQKNKKLLPRKELTELERVYQEFILRNKNPQIIQVQ